MANPLAGNRGPAAGNTQRFRNTLANNASKQSYQAPVSSASAVGYGDQLANARYQYLQQLAALKSQRAQVGQQYGVAIADARTQAVQNMGAAEGNALDRGVLGGSNDMSNRAAVIAARQRAKTEAEMQRAQGVMGIQQQKLGAQGAYYNQVGSIQNAMAQEQMANTVMAFQQDQFDAMQQNYQDIYKDILGQLRAQKQGYAPRQRQGTANSYAYMTGSQPFNGMQDGRLTKAERRAIQAAKSGRGRRY